MSRLTFVLKEQKGIVPLKKFGLLALGILFLMISCQGTPTVQSVKKKVWKHLGGKSNYEQARYLEFIWEVKRKGKRLAARHHLWDRYTGDYVMTTRNLKSGDSVEVYFNVNSKKGIAVGNGEVMEGKVKENLLKLGYESYINDSYWLLSATKLNDPGVRVTLATDQSDRKENEAVLHLSFEKVGLTPGDQYWLYVEPSGRIRQWKYKLQGGREGRFDWLDEKDSGMGLRFSTRKVNAADSVVIDFPLLKFSGSMDEQRFKYQP